MIPLEAIAQRAPPLRGPVEQRVLILAPTGNDARLTQSFLIDAGIQSEIVRDLTALCGKVVEGCGTLLLAEETLTVEAIEPLLETISRQPSWSDIPLVLITSGGETSQTRLRRLTTLGPIGNVTMLERPFRPVTLLSAIETALRARNKQYQVRDLLADVRSSERRVHSILASITDGFVAVDTQWRFTYVNAAYLRLVSSIYSSETDLLGQNLWEKFPDLLGTPIEGHYRHAMATQTPASFEIFYAPIATWLEVRIYPAPDTLSIYVRNITERKHHEESLTALTRQVSAQAKTFDTTLSNITDFAYILDREGRFIYANKPLLDLWKLTLDDARGKTFFELNYPKDLAEKLQREIEHVISTKEVVRGETAYTGASGRDGYYEYIFNPVFAPDGTVEGIAGSTRVTTERKKTEAIAERRRLVLQLIAEDAPLEKIFEALVHMVELEADTKARASILTVDAHGRLRHGAAPNLPDDYNRALDGLETGPSAAPGRTATWASLGAHVADIATDPSWTALRGIARDKNLHTCWSTPILSRQGQLLGTLAMYYPGPHEPAPEDRRLVATAINTAAVAIERKRAEEALRASEAQLRLVTDHASVFLVHCDRDHRYKFVNRAYAARFGLEPQALLGARVRDILGEKVYAIILPYMESALAGERVEFELELPYDQLTPRWVHTVYVPELDRDGVVVGFVGVISDVTLRKQSELELMRARDKALEASRAKDDFLAALSHELRTPLNPVLLIASEAATDPALAPDVRADFETIARNATLEARLIDDLLDLTRITHGKMLLDKRTVDVHAVLADALETVASDLNEKRLKLDVKLTAGSRHVFGDPARLQQIFWNVLKNAVKFTPRGGSVLVETRACEKSGRCSVMIRDSGIGMTDDEVRRVFDAFSQGNHAAAGGSHRFGGLGLGLAISRMLVELHAGQISAASEGINRGATFTIDLPLTDASTELDAILPAHRQDSPPDTRQPGGGRVRHILVVEDHSATRLSLTRLLSRRGYVVTAAGSVNDALAKAEENIFDLVVSDIGLPDGDGYSLMTQLRDRHDLTGIALSGYGMEQDIARSRAAGFTDHLIKPVSAQALDRVLSTWENSLAPESD